LPSVWRASILDHYATFVVVALFAFLFVLLFFKLEQKFYVLLSHNLNYPLNSIQHCGFQKSKRPRNNIKNNIREIRTKESVKKYYLNT
jgi:penicillin-binding protein-related factor A (putative recombinase)